MAKVVLSERISDADNCPFARFDYQKDVHMCLFGLYQRRCMAEDGYSGDFNLELCNFVDNENREER